jgi:hypothetical protein
MVENQDQALEFYTTILGFQKMAYISFGTRRWLTVVSPDAPEGMELLLEPMAGDDLILMVGPRFDISAN